MANSPKAWYQLPWLHIIRLLALIALFYTSAVSSSNPGISNYHDRCAAVIPESTPTDPEFTIIPFPPNQDGYYLGGDEVLKHQDSSRFYYSPNNRRVLLFRTHKVYRTNVDGVYKVEASLILEPSRIMHGFADSSLTLSSWSRDGALSFEIEGFWSKSSGKLCMVGSASTYSREGKHDSLSALLKLNDVRSESNITSLIRGTLESLSSADDSTYFQPLSLLMFPLMNYTYTEVTKEADYGCMGDADADAAKSSLGLPLSFSFCSAFSRANSFELQYSNDCSSTKNCNPFGGDDGYLPQIMSLSSFQCSDDRRSVRFLVEFQNGSYYSSYSPFNPNKTLVAEGSWNSEKNQLCVVACRISTPTNSLDSSLVEDCSSRLSLRFPAVLSMNTSSTIVGHMWSNKTAGVSGHFDNITFHIYRDNRIEIPGLKYEYTQIDRARNSCRKKQHKRSDGMKYPDGNPYNMQFHSFRIRKVSNLWGYVDLISVGDKIIPMYSYSMSRNSQVKENLQPVNMSYRLSMKSYNASSKSDGGFSISAEGVYDPETGVLCMAGCKNLESNNQIRTNSPLECEIIVDVQFPPLNSGDRIKGLIKSTREKSSPQYFESLSFSAVPYYSQGIWRMNCEIVMSLISITLVCVFVGCQILYVKKHRNVIPFVSLLMLVVLTLGQMMPLVLNFEALFFSKQNGQSFRGSSGSLLEVNEVTVRTVTMVAFLLQVRLLQLVLSARLADANQKAAWIAEAKTLCVSLPLCIVGGLIALAINWKKYEFGGQDRMMNFTYIDSKQHSLWMDLRSYAGLILDGFLVPQIILNIFHNSRQNVLSCFFYMGTAFVRVLPHAYDLFRAHYYVDGFDWSYVYADPAGDYYSTAWDMIIPAGCVLFCGIIYVQQRNGGRYFLPKMLKETAGYQKVPVFADL
ncbi:uncharacterized protein [Euphorbia lathyris]|uniref:uncharacterized protein n=1 Tax=Euphorbia lathyris TaxID=212925 RepID=UPI003313ED87